MCKQLPTMCRLGGEVLLSWCLIWLGTVTALPVQMTVNQRGSECLYETLNAGESVTMAVFVLSGPELLANVQFTGPVASLDTETGIELMQSIEQFDKERHPEAINFIDSVDFEHLTLESEDDEDFEISPVSNDESAAERKQRRAVERKNALEARQRREQQKAMQQRKVRKEGEPYQKTVKAELAGWYRFCIHSSHNQIVVEIDMRKESDFGLNEYGAVMTLEQKEVSDEDRLMDEDSAVMEGIKDEDFDSTKDKLKTLRRLLADIQTKQQQERHRLIVHAATNEHSHSRMVLSSLLETILFMAVTGFQVFTIRRWFKGAPVLGR